MNLGAMTAIDISDWWQPSQSPDLWMNPRIADWFSVSDCSGTVLNGGYFSRLGKPARAF